MFIHFYSNDNEENGKIERRVFAVSVSHQDLVNYS